MWDGARTGVRRLGWIFVHSRLTLERLDGASLRLGPNVGVVLEHVFRDVSCHVPDDFIPRATLSEISNEGVTGVMETSFDICPGPRTAGRVLRSKAVLGGLHHEYWLEKVAA